MTYRREELLSFVKKVYKTSILFPKKEPLRYKIRELADEILADFIILKNQNPIKQNISKILEKIEIMDSFLEIAKEQNWVSPNEILEIKNHYQNLRQEIETLQKNSSFETKRQNSNQLFSPQKASHPVNQQNLLNERQQKILEFLKNNEKVQVWQIQQICSEVSKRTLRRDFQRLLKKGIIQRIGEKNNTFYVLQQE